MASKFYTPILFPLVGTISGIYLQSCFGFSLALLVVGFVVALGALGVRIVYPSSKGLISAHGEEDRRSVSNHRILRDAHYVCSSGRAQAALTTVLFCFLGAILLQVQHIQRDKLITRLADKTVDLVVTVIDKDEWGDWQKGDLLKVRVNEVLSAQMVRDTASQLLTMSARPEEDPKDPSRRIRAPALHHEYCSFDLICYLHSHTKCQVGDTVMLKKVTFKIPSTISLAGNPTFDDYLLKEGFMSSLFLSSWQCQVVGRPMWSISRWLWDIKHRIYLKLKKVLSERTFNFFGLIFLGNKQQTSVDQLRRTFNYWGLAHYLARSGLHIVLFIMMWSFLLRLVPIHLFYKRIFLVLLCFVYDLLSWTSIPFARAYYVFLLMQAGQLIHEQTNFLHLLTLTCLTILLFNPMQLFFLDFQLTFALTFTLVLLPS